MSHYKNIIAKCKIFCMALMILMLAQPTYAEEQTTLVFLTWPDYMDPAIIDEFEQRTNIAIKQIYFESTTERDELLIATEGKGFDITLINDSSIKTLAKNCWLEPIDEKEMPNLKRINPRWRAMHKNGKTYSVPYFWGSLGIAYRKDLISYPVSSWMDLLQPAQNLHGKVAMIESARGVMGAALKSLGYSLNSTNIQEIKKAEALLQAQAPAVKTYKYTSHRGSSALVSGEIAISMMHSNYASMLQKHHDQIVFVLPKEGSNIWIDYISVLNASNNKVAAKEFINFLNEPEIAARLAQFVRSATPNIDAEALLPEEFKNDPAIYPSKEALAKSETYNNQPAQTQKNRTAFISRLVN